eukprot:CAMPEP_0170581610 /NCGR_PEP_ID=MMETSP0224-20130122/7134_1 /TAXON_ID=285029 /ORGANISM="Togula jolla, Strain CCCM 725" /LENGTH=39 /DNA_ID= /DNA_START= /DNA_END= /DNA_ORIENTATION=
MKRIPTPHSDIKSLEADAVGLPADACELVEMPSAEVSLV